MNKYSQRIAAGLAMAAVPALIALGGAASAAAQTAPSAPGPSVSHPAFPHQDHTPKPGTAVHHHHQQHRGA